MAIDTLLWIRQKESRQGDARTIARVGVHACDRVMARLLEKDEPVRLRRDGEADARLGDEPVLFIVGKKRIEAGLVGGGSSAGPPLEGETVTAPMHIPFAVHVVNERTGIDRPIAVYGKACAALVEKRPHG